MLFIYNIFGAFAHGLDKYFAFWILFALLVLFCKYLIYVENPLKSMIFRLLLLLLLFVSVHFPLWISFCFWSDILLVSVIKTMAKSRLYTVWIIIGNKKIINNNENICSKSRKSVTHKIFHLLFKNSIIEMIQVHWTLELAVLSWILSRVRFSIWMRRTNGNKIV